MLESIDYILYWVNDGVYKDLEWFISKDKLDRYKDKNGIFGKLLYIDKKFRNNNYGDMLIEYSKTLGDYVWGVTIKGVIDNYWVSNKNRTKICEWMEQDGTISILTATI